MRCRPDDLRGHWQFGRRHRSPRCAQLIVNLSASGCSVGKAEDREEMLVTRRGTTRRTRRSATSSAVRTIVFDTPVVLDDEGDVTARAWVQGGVAHRRSRPDRGSAGGSATPRELERSRDEVPRRP
jgi:hypothetical protein